MSEFRLQALVDWLGPEGALAGLEKSAFTNADLMRIARSEGIEVETKASRKQLTTELAMARIKRIEKSNEQLVELSRDELKRYFAERLVSNREILELLNNLEIAPSRKTRGSLADFAANEISDLGMYSRVAQGRNSRSDGSEKTSSRLPPEPKKR